MKKIILFSVLMTGIIFSCSKNEGNKIATSEECIECNSKSEVNLSPPVLLKEYDVTLFEEFVSCNEYQKYNVTQFGTVDMDSLFVYKVIDHTEKIISVPLETGDLTKRRYLFGMYCPDSTITVIIHEVTTNATTFTVKDYSYNGALLLSYNCDIQTGKILYISPVAKEDGGAAWRACVRKALEACMADPECALLCMILGPECAASVAIGCYISVNNGTAGH